MTEQSNIQALVVDDSFLNRQLLKTILEEEFQIQVTEAGDGAEALDCLTRLTPDFAVLDLMMPVMDGMEALQRIRESGKKFPVIILTADIQEETKERCLQMGVYGFINKPSSEMDIIKMVKVLIQKIDK
jgi:CheY-like chemotaxis protein